MALVFEERETEIIQTLTNLSPTQPLTTTVQVATTEREDKTKFELPFFAFTTKLCFDSIYFKVN